MNSRTDQELLRDYTEDGSEAAFSEVVRRHIDFVYSVALRLVRDAQLAEDVSQGVFLALARNGGRLADRGVLAGWLHRTAQNLSANAVRADARRHACEQEAAAMKELLTPEPDANWESIAPHLDAALSQLSEPDRDALLLRYFQQKSANEMAQTLGISGEAAQKRVNRAVERLREFFAKRGIAVGATGLVALISRNAVQAAPASLTATLSATSFTEAATHISTVLSTAKIIAMTTLQKALIAAAVVAAVGTGIYQARQAALLRDRGQALQQHQGEGTKQRESSQPALDAAANTPANRSFRVRLSAPRRRVIPSTNSVALGTFQSSQLYALLAKKVATLTLAQVEPYLNANGRSAASLLAAFRTTRDPALLAEAAQKYPNDPQVAFESAIQINASPEDRRHWLDAFKQTAPENSLPSYLSALDHFKAGQSDEAVQDLNAAPGKQQFQDYSRDRIQTDEEAYLAAGYPPGEAKLIANAFLIEPYLPQVRELSQNLVGLAAAYQQTGDQNSQDAALQIAINLGRLFGDPSAGETLMHQLIGISVETAALKVMDPAGPYDGAGQTVQDRLDQLAQQKEAIRTLTAEADPLWQTLSDQGWVSFHTELGASGEETALRWLVGNYAKK